MRDADLPCAACRPVDHRPASFIITITRCPTLGLRCTKPVVLAVLIAVAGCVQPPIRSAHQASERANIDDGPAAVGQHVWHYRACYAHDASDIGVELPRNLLVARQVHRPEHFDAGVVDHNVQ